jgi:hypothetical protein
MLTLVCRQIITWFATYDVNKTLSIKTTKKNVIISKCALTFCLLTIIFTFERVSITNVKKNNEFDESFKFWRFLEKF